ncbi:MAG: FAD-binding protein [Elusimicrobia bacterium]|nr:FAD-binding protein [Elusimicrobiota bacterium]
MKAPVSTDASLRRLYSRDQGDVPALLRWVFSSENLSVVQPRSEEEAVDAVREAYAKGVPIVFRGAGSTAFGQSVPVLGGLVVDTCFLKTIRRFDPDQGTVTVDAGVRWSDLAAYLAERRCAIGSYPSSWYSTVGGWVQTGGCGILTNRFGPLRAQVTRLRVCAAEGAVLDLTPNHQDFEAYFSTEGQMGLILQVTLRIRPHPKGEFPLVVECRDLADAWKLFVEGRARPEALHAALWNTERMRHFNRTFQDRMRRKQSGLGERGLVSGAPAVLLYAESREGWLALRDWVRGQGRTELPVHVATYLWGERFYPLKGKRADQSFLGNELLVPDAQAPRYAATLESLAHQAKTGLAIEANAAAPGESVVIASFYAEAGSAEVYARLPLVFTMDRVGVESFQGRLYHIGVYNTPFVDRKFPPAQLQALLAAKRRLDPKTLFNPGKFFDFRTRLTPWLSPERHWRAARWLIPRLEGKPWALRLAAWATKFLPVASEPKATAAPLNVAARECVNCGFCIPVCPAYLATRDERTTARGKLGLALAIDGGFKPSPADVELLHSCMHCGACTAVCQSTLDLVPAWRELEAKVARAAGGKPAAAIEKFVAEVEASPDYLRLLRRGYIVEREAPAER